MNLNNKYLAIGLSVAAVVLVSYQIFFNKTKDTKRAVPQPAQSVNVGTQPARPSVSPPATTSSTPPPRPTSTASTPARENPAPVTSNLDSGPLIDYNSEILLKRVRPEMMEPFPPQEIDPEFGSPIFTKQTNKAEPPPSSEPVREIEFVLNAIVIDSTKRLAIINDTILKIGDVILGAEITAIINNKVILKLNQQEIVLSTDSKIKKLKLIGGTGDH